MKNTLKTTFVGCLFIFLGHSAGAQEMTVQQSMDKDKTTIRNETNVRVKEKLHKEFIDNTAYQKEKEFAVNRSINEQNIAFSYAAANDLPNFVSWVSRITVHVWKAHGLSKGFEDLVNLQKGEPVRQAIMLMLDSITQDPKTKVLDKNLLNYLVRSYIKTLDNPLDTKIFPYLEMLSQEYDNMFPFDLSHRIKPDEVSLQQTATYVYVMNLNNRGDDNKIRTILARAIAAQNITRVEAESMMDTMKKSASWKKKFEQDLLDRDAQFPEFVKNILAKNTLDGVPIDIEASKSKYILLDFWGSWCVPCRASHPDLLKLYGTHKSRGLEIVSVASEAAKELEIVNKIWRNAVEQDGLTWPQVLNNDGIEQFDAVKTLAITMFPTKILVDENFNKVAVWNGHVDIKEVEKKIVELMNK